MTNLTLSKKPTRAIWSLLALALIVRVVYLYLYAGLPDWYQLTVDNHYHLHWAESIAGGNLFGDTTYFRAPFYIYCLAGLFALAGKSILIGRLFGLALGLGIILISYLIGQKLFSHRIGLWAAAIYALAPVAIYFESELLLDPLFTLLSLATLYQYLRFKEKPRSKTGLMTGLLFGLAAITRPTILIFAPLLLWDLLRSNRSHPNRMKSIGLMGLGLLLTIGPVTLRNISVAGDPVLISSQAGINFYIGNHPTADGFSATMPPPLGHNWRLSDTRYIAESDSQRALRPGEQSTYWFKRTFSSIADQPLGFVVLYLKKLYLTISTELLSNNRSLPTFFGRISLLGYNPITFGLIFPFALLGATLSFRSKPGIRLLVSLIAIYSLVTALFFVSTRFLLPLLPLYALLAASGLERIRTYPGHNLRLIWPGLTLALVGALVVNLSLASTSNSRSTQDMLSKGLMHYNRGEFQEAIQYYRQARSINDTFPTTNLNLGLCYFRLGQGDSARHYFEMEKTNHPDRSKAYLNLASFYLVNQQYEAAEREINLALEKRPYDITARKIQLRTIVAAKSPGWLDQFHTAATEALTATAADIYLLVEVGQLYYQAGALELAKKYLTRAVESGPPPIETDDTAFDADHSYSAVHLTRLRAQAHAILGAIYGQAGQLKSALTHSRQAVSLDPEQLMGYVNLISALGASGRYQEADSILTRVRARFPGNSLLEQFPTPR